MRVACLQMRSGISTEENLVTLKQMTAEAVAKGAQYIQTPEMTTLLQKNKAALLADIDPEKCGAGADNNVIRFVSSLAKQYGVWLHLGSFAIKLPNGKVANRGLLFSPEGILVEQYDKIHMFDVDLPNNETWRESALYQPGTNAVVANCADFNLGMSICYDLRFPHLYRSLAMAGADILTCPAAFTQHTGKAHWHILLRARAIENGAYVIAAAQGGTHADTRLTYGHSIIINPWGEIIGELDHDEPGVLVCDIDIKDVEKTRSQIPSLKLSANYSSQSRKGNIPQ